VSEYAKRPKRDAERPLPSLASGSARLLASRVTAAAAMFVSFLVLARALAPTERGAVAFVMTAGIVLAGVSSIGLDEATAVFASRWPETRRELLANLFSITLTTAAIAGAATVAVLAMFPSIRPEGVDSPELAALVIGAVGLRAIGANVAFLLGCSRYREQAIAFAAGPVILSCVLAIAWSADNLSIRQACGLWAAAQVLGALVGLLAVIRSQLPGRPSLTLARRTIDFGLRAWAGTVAGFLNARIDQVIMGLISTEAALGLYAVAANASEVALYVPSTVALVLIPTVARETSEVRIETTLRVFRVLILVATGVVGIGLLCSPLIPIVFGDNYRPSIEPYVLLLPGSIPFVALSVFSGSLAAPLSPGRSSIAPLTALLTGITLDLVLIPTYGEAGAAIAATAAFTAGGAAATLLYVLMYRVPGRALIPRTTDVAILREAVQRTLRLGKSGSR
jgi:O-antigen/teichoic acid export membrane protein